jgi:hypothetical protein
MCVLCIGREIADPMERRFSSDIGKYMIFVFSNAIEKPYHMEHSVCVCVCVCVCLCVYMKLLPQGHSILSNATLKKLYTMKHDVYIFICVCIYIYIYITCVIILVLRLLQGARSISSNAPEKVDHMKHAIVCVYIYIYICYILMRVYIYIYAYILRGLS